MQALEVAIVILWRLRDRGIGLGPEILLTRRPAGVHLAGSWELPGGKIEPGETPIQAARRELLEEVGLDVLDLDLLMARDHAYPDRVVRLHAFLGQLDPPEDHRDVVAEHRWVPLDDLHRYELPAANAPITAAIMQRLAAAPG